MQRQMWDIAAWKSFRFHGDSSAGQFLLSEPFLTDPWFGRKTVFVCDHDPDGTVGLVLDNGTGRRLKEVLPESEDWGIDHEVFLGGPVHDDSLFFLHTFGDEVANAMPVLPGLWLGGDLDGIRALLSRPEKALGQIRFFIGYSGWAAGQLEAEMERHSCTFTRARGQNEHRDGHRPRRALEAAFGGERAGILESAGVAD